MFRGKRLDNDKWIYGYLVCDKNGRSLIFTGELECEQVTNTEFWFYKEVRPDTIGQCLGIKDRDDVTIYEGDIWGAEYNERPFLLSKFFYYYVVLSNGRFMVKNKSGHIWDIPHKEWRRGKVFGNKWDNPELLEVG